jgi:ABC-type transporter Mla subunit MlaD
VTQLVTVAKVAMYTAAAFCLFAAGILLLQMQEAARKMDQAISQGSQVVGEAQRRLVDTSQNLNALLIQLGLTSDELRRAAVEQRVYWNKAGAETVSALQRTNDVLRQVEETTHSVDESQKSISTATVTALQALPQAAQASTAAMQQAARDLETLDKILADQNIPATLLHVNRTADHLESMSYSLDVAVKRWTKPQSVFKSLIFGGLDATSKVAIIAK